MFLYCLQIKQPTFVKLFREYKLLLFNSNTKPISMLISNFHYQITLFLNYHEKLIFYNVDYEKYKQSTGSAVRKPVAVRDLKLDYLNYCLKSVNNEMNLLRNRNQKK